MIVSAPALRFAKPCGFMAVDGVNGAGKGTLIDRIMAELERRGAPALRTREPGDTPLGRELRRLLLASAPGTVPPLAELFLFAADRASHVKQVIEPALAEGRLVITDRYYYSTAAFQGYGRELDLGAVSEINRLAIDRRLPDLLLLLDLEPEEGLRRARARDARDAAGGPDGFEGEELDFHRRLRRGFLEVAAACSEPCVVLDARRGADEVWEEAAPLIGAWADACRAARTS